LELGFASREDLLVGVEEDEVVKLAGEPCEGAGFEEGNSGASASPSLGLRQSGSARACGDYGPTDVGPFRFEQLRHG
jgi:hypothetical protein